MARSSRRARPTRRLGRLLGLAMIPVAVVGTGALVMGSSYSVFNATTSNPTNSWSTGSVALADDDSNTAMFTVTGMKPNDTGSRCIAVTSTGTLASTVKLYGTGFASTNALGTYINLTITQGTGSTFAASPSCSGFTQLASNSAVYSGTLANFASTATNWASGTPTSGAWTPTGTGSETRVYQFTYTLSSTAPNTTENSSASIGFTWEAQNN